MPGDSRTVGSGVCELDVKIEHKEEVMAFIVFMPVLKLYRGGACNELGVKLAASVTQSTGGIHAEHLALCYSNANADGQN